MGTCARRSSVRRDTGAAPARGGPPGPPCGLLGRHNQQAVRLRAAHRVRARGRRAQRHGADNLRAANSDSSAARRHRYGQSVVSVPYNWSRSKATKWTGHSVVARAAPAPRRASRSCNRSNASRPSSHTTSSPSSAVASGSRAASATTSGNARPSSVPRLERSTTCPASTETRSRNPSHLGSAAQPGRRPGSGMGELCIGSGSVHVTHHGFHAVRPPFECSDPSDCLRRAGLSSCSNAPR